MKLFIAFLVLLIAQSSKGQSISCLYAQPSVFSPYTCNLSIQNPEGFQFDSVDGEHYPGQSDEDVTILWALNQNTLNIPRIICNQFPNLVNFSIINSQVRVLSSESFEGCQNVERVVLYNNQIQEIPEQSFSAAGNLRVLDINNNQLTTLHVNSFTGTQLESLNLNFNQFETFNTEWLESINETLTTFDIMSNRLQELQPGAFGNLGNLRSLNLGTNFFTDLPGDVFIGLLNLQILFLHGNLLNLLRPSWFNSMLALEELRLEFNLVPSLPARVFANNNQLRDVGLSFNQITSINRNAFGDLTALTTFYGEINFINAIDPVS